MSPAEPASSGVRGWEWAFIVALLLFAWGLRLCLLEDVPPGWRDDELINIHALSSQLLEGRFPVYYLGASGHEPLYHHLHAGIHAVLGFNVLSGHILSVGFGLLSISLTYTLVRRLFPAQPATAAVAALSIAASFWSLMYSRTAIRHISLVPFAVGTVYAFWRRIEAPGSRVWRWGLTGFLLGVTLYTYTASRLLPVLLVIFVAYLALVHPDRFRSHWRGMAIAFVVMVVVAAPLGVAIVRGRTKNAVEGIGADARVAELAGPLRALRDGHPGPLLRGTWRTLGMFHATGDPEWLYNIPGRPVFNLLGGILLWVGVGLCLYRWRRPRYFLLLAWLGVGLSPAFVSTPPASLGHTIFAQPVVYLLPALALGEISCRQRDWLGSHRTSMIIYPLFLAVFLVGHAVRDLRDYFLVWPKQEMVRVLYRADYREIARYLNAHPQLQDVAVSSTLLGPWDRLALDVDTPHDDVEGRVRLFDPGRCLVWTAGQRPASVILTAWPPASPAIRETLGFHTTMSESLSPDLRLYALSAQGDPQTSSDDARLLVDGGSAGPGPHQFGNGLALVDAYWLEQDGPTPGREAELVTSWVLAEPLDLPPLPIVANPPPPGTYAGPRLAVFAHLLASNVQSDSNHQGDSAGSPVGLEQDQPSVLAVDDGLWVDPLTLELGDRFIQIHRFHIPDDPSVASYEVDLGLYDPMTGSRWAVLGAPGEPASDHVLMRNEDLTRTVPD